MGSLVHAAERLAREGWKSSRCSLETSLVQRAQGSQRYPFPFNLLYPSTGDFIASSPIRAREVSCTA